MTNLITKPLKELISPYRDEILQPYENRWWVITSNHELVFYRTFDRPQCSTDERMARRLSEIANEQGLFTNIQFIPWVFVPVKLSDLLIDVI